MSAVGDKLSRMYETDKYDPPSPYDDLNNGIRLALDWSSDRYLVGSQVPHLVLYRENLLRWAKDAQYMLGYLGVQLTKPSPGKLPPMHCVKCNHYNEYVGQEHLVKGVYTCRSCK